MKLWTETETPVFPADTFGWDTVYAIPFEKLNNAIYARTDIFPMAFESDQGATPRISNGSFDPWSVVAGGSGEIINMCLPFTGMDFTNGTETHTGLMGEAMISLKLSAITQETPPTAQKKHVKEVIEFKLAPRNPSDPAVITIEILYQGTTPGTIAQTQIQDLMKEWLNDNCEQFNFVFAAVNLSEKASEAGGADNAFKWMLPSTTAYAVRDQGTTATGVFAVLCMTDGRPKSPVRDVSVAAIPNDAASGFLISERRFIGEVVKPFIHQIFQVEDANGVLSPATPDDFYVSDDFKIKNSSRIVIPDLEVKKKPEDATGKTTNAYLKPDSFIIEVTDTKLVMRLQQLNYAWPYGLGGIQVFVDFISRSTIRQENNKFYVDEESVECPRADVEKSAALAWAEIGVPIVTSVVLAAGGAMIGRAVAGAPALVQGGQKVGTVTAFNVSVAGGSVQAATQLAAEANAQGIAQISGLVARTGVSVWGAIGAVLGAVAGGIYPVLENISLNNAKEGAPDFSEFLQMAMNSVEWPGVDGFDVTSARLNKSLQIGVNPTHPDRPDTA